MIGEGQKFCCVSRAKEFQIEARETLKELLTEANKLKANAIACQNEDAANTMLCFEEIISGVINELSMWIALKDDDPPMAWDYLVSAQSAISSALQAQPLKEQKAIEGYYQHLEALEYHMFPQQLFYSPGLIIREAKCSICKQSYGECEHVVGKAYMGELCAREVIDADIEEVSVVNNPANKYCRIIRFSQGNMWRDFLTWHLVPGERQQLDNESMSNPYKEEELEVKDSI